MHPGHAILHATHWSLLRHLVGSHAVGTFGQVIKSCCGTAGLRPFTPEEVADALAREEMNGYGIMAPSGPEVHADNVHSHVCPSVTFKSEEQSSEDIVLWARVKGGREEQPSTRRRL